MSKGAKLVLGVLSVLPMLILMVWTPYVFSKLGMWELFEGGKPVTPPRFDKALFAQMFAVNVTVIVLSFSQMLGYAIYLFRRIDIRQEWKIFWVLALFFMSGFALPLAWFFNIWRDPPSDESLRMDETLDALS